MMKFVTVKLELVRPGPPHNQLLSPLTPYMALCGEGSPITFHIDIEHHQLLSQLDRLRYFSREASGIASVPDRVRQAAVLEVGSNVTRILSQIRTLLAEVARARIPLSELDDPARAVHLRLVLGGSELALIPFEMAFAPQAFPGEGLELALQLAMPIAVTRETRSSRQSPVPWDRKIEPRVLFIAASPEGLTVPTEAHVHALRAAVEPWVGWTKGSAQSGGMQAEQGRLDRVRKRLRLLVNASIEDIREYCSREQFTHVHILAHGDTYEVAGEQRFGVALCRRDDRTRKEVVSGPRLAEALQAAADTRGWRSSPLMVTLATCDSGNLRSVLVPGGSIAHDLHVAGIPWVLASQFPLTIPGSVRMTEALYPLLLRGDDPREAVYEVRQQLHLTASQDHDWAALVVYATVADDLADHSFRFFEERSRGLIDLSLSRADDLATRKGPGAEARDTETDLRLKEALDALDRWTARLPEGEEEKDRSRRAECLGMHGSVHKRIALLRWSSGNPDDYRGALRKSLGFYRDAMSERALSEDKHHWVATQALSLIAVLGAEPEPGTFRLTMDLAERDLTHRDDVKRAWAHATRAELAMLGIYHVNTPPDAALQGMIVHDCREIVRLMGMGSFHVDSTRRQFQRYVNIWKNEKWDAIASSAFEALRPPLSA